HVIPFVTLDDSATRSAFARQPQRLVFEIERHFIEGKAAEQRNVFMEGFVALFAGTRDARASKAGRAQSPYLKLAQHPVFPRALLPRGDQVEKPIRAGLVDEERYTVGVMKRPAPVAVVPESAGEPRQPGFELC